MRLNSCIVIAFLVASFICCFPESNPSKDTEGIYSSELVLNVSEDDGIRCEEYVDAEGNPTIAADKHYAAVMKELDENGRVISEYYFDENNEPVRMSDGQYGVLREYDEQGHEIKVTYVDAVGNPIRSSSGFVSVLKTYDDKGHGIKDEYVNENGNLVYRTEGYAAREREYNEKGQCIRITNLNIYGEPTNSSSGYAIEERTLNDNGQVHTVMYFAPDGMPAKGTFGQYGEAYEYDELGRRYKVTSLDENGETVLNKEGYATVVKSFKANNSTDTEMYYDTVGNPVKLSHGQYGIRRENGRTIYLNKYGRMSLFLSMGELLHYYPWIAVLVGFGLCLLTVFFPRTLNVILLIGYAFFIVYMTLLYREGGDSGVKQALWSYKRFFSNRSARVETFQNVWLFVPFGTLLYAVFKRRWMLIIPLLFSVTIEITQYVTGRGFFEVDDIINNAVGGCIGIVAGELLQWLLVRRNEKNNDGFWNKARSN